MIYHVVSMSTGKDSVAAWLYARATLDDLSTLRVAFADTGNEHQLVYEHLDYLEGVLGPVVRLKADFTAWWWHRRDYILAKWHLPHKDWPNGVPSDVIERVLKVFDAGPTGNPYLDLCMIKGRFPSRRAQFCTQFLKTEPLVEYQLSLMKSVDDAVWSWQGVRRDESANRQYAAEFEERGGGIFIYRPIVRWKAMDSIEAHALFGIRPNPLYKLGMNRVGCMPCINASKEEILEISKRFPQHVDRIEEWEHLVSIASKRGLSSFFPAPEDGRADRVGRNIRQVVQWSRTSRGGKQYGMLESAPATACASSYGLCDQADEIPA